MFKIYLYPQGGSNDQVFGRGGRVRVHHNNGDPGRCRRSLLFRFRRRIHGESGSGWRRLPDQNQFVFIV